MRRNASRFAWRAALCSALFASSAFGQRIVLVRPSSSDATILSAFAHLQGELAVHDFEIVVVDENAGITGPDALERVAEEEHALAAVCLLRTRGSATADIWIGDRATGKTSRRTISTPQRSEAASVLAVRAVDLLRASLRELAPSEPLPSDIVGAAPASAPPKVLAWAAPPAARAGFALEAGAIAQTSAHGFALAYGPSIGFGYDAARELALRLVFQGPIWGGHYTTTNASAVLLQEQLFAEARLRFWEHAAFSYSALLALGAHHLSVRGEASAPYLARTDTAWTALGSVGLGAEWRFAPAAALSVRARALALAPEPEINVGPDHVGFGRPLLQINGGVDAAF